MALAIEAAIDVEFSISGHSGSFRLHIPITLDRLQSNFSLSAIVMTNPSPYITAKQAAEEVGLSYVRIRQLLQQGRVQGAIKPQRDWLIPVPVEILPPSGKNR